jgi:hypothetical protein
MKQLTRRNTGNSHSYMIDGFAVPGVTTVIGQLDKPALINWAAETTASYAVDNWNSLSALPTSEKMKQMVNARWAKNKEAIAKGNEIHAMAQALMEGRPVDVPPLLEASVRALVSLLEAWQVEALQNEVSLGHSEELYAGTADMVASSDKLGGTFVFDFKTGKRAYNEVALQLAAYSRCDLAAFTTEQTGPRGGKKPAVWTTKDAIPVDQEVAYAIHIADGVAELIPATIDDDVYQAFAALADLWWTWTRRTDYRRRDKPGYNPPLGEALHAAVYEPRDQIGFEPPF